MTIKNFRLPITMDVPTEVSSAINERVSEDLSYTNLREKKIETTYNNIRKQTNLRKVGEYLLNNWTSGEISINSISRALRINSASIKIIISDLNFWRQYPLKMIPVPKRIGYIQSCLKDINVTEKYLRRKSRTIASMEQVFENMDNQIKVKKESAYGKTSEKQKVRQKSNNNTQTA
jgi:hypothetical protein